MIPDHRPSPTIRDTSPDELVAGAIAAGIEEVYLDAFSAPPYHEDRSAARAFVERLRSQADREGHRLPVALEGGRVLGFAYGYTTRPGQWWHDRVTPELEPSLVERWFADAFVLVEFAVLGGARGRGIGGALLDHTLRGQPQRTALAMAHQEANPAVSFYLARGWRVLAEGFRFHERDASRLILGRELPQGEQ